MTLDEFGKSLDTCPAGATIRLDYSTYASLFPPGEPDAVARGKAWNFARARGCEMKPRPQEQRVDFTKRLTNLTALRG
jgi:hypothetical protein